MQKGIERCTQRIPSCLEKCLSSSLIDGDCFWHVGFKQFKAASPPDLTVNGGLYRE